VPKSIDERSKGSGLRSRALAALRRHLRTD
jgi:hypothetical protein